MLLPAWIIGADLGLASGRVLSCFRRRQYLFNARMRFCSDQTSKTIPVCLKNIFSGKLRLLNTYIKHKARRQIDVLYKYCNGTLLHYKENMIYVLLSTLTCGYRTQRISTRFSVGKTSSISAWFLPVSLTRRFQQSSLLAAGGYIIVWVVLLFHKYQREKVDLK